MGVTPIYSQPEQPSAQGRNEQAFARTFEQSEQAAGQSTYARQPDRYSADPLSRAERIARIIDPAAWALVDHWRTKANRADLEARCSEKAGPSLAKAATILDLCEAAA